MLELAASLKVLSGRQRGRPTVKYCLHILLGGGGGHGSRQVK